MSLGQFNIVDSTLREGEQFAESDFSSEDKVEIAQALNAFGVEYIEVTSPVVSPRSRYDCERLASLGLKSRIAAHVRCREADIQEALDCGVTAINMFMASSPLLRTHSHGRDASEIVKRVIDIASWLRSVAPDVELRFSCEDAFRTQVNELLDIYRPLSATGLFNRFGVADTVSIATPMVVMERVGQIAEVVGTHLEFHGHNDTGCAIANAHAALMAGATHIDTCVLGIGERNGITSLEGLVACLYVMDPDMMRAKYDLQTLSSLVELVARKAGVEIPFNQCIVGSAAFTHKAGIHAKAVLANPKAYEVLDPNDFGRDRNVMVAHRLAGWNGLHRRAEALGIDLSPESLKEVTSVMKGMADERALSLREVDHLLVTAATVG
jgi:homocitrate synthase